MIWINKRQVKLLHKKIQTLKAKLLKLKDQILLWMIKIKGRNKFKNNWWISLRTGQIHHATTLLGLKVNYLRK